MNRPTLSGIWTRSFLFSMAAAIVTALAPATAAAAPVVLKGVSYVVVSDEDPTSIGYTAFIDKVNRRAKGELKIEYLGGPEVIPPGEQMTALSKGVIQLLVTPGYHSSIVPEVNATLLAEITPPEQRKVGFYDLMADIHKQRLGVLPLARVDHGVLFYLYTNKRVKKLDDLRGLKFRSNANYDPVMKALGIVSVAMGGGEIYTAMERGLVVGFPWTAFIHKRGFAEVVKYAIDHGFWGGGASYIYMNLKTWEGLSGRLKNLVMDVAKEVEMESLATVDRLMQAERNRLRAAGVEFIKLSDGQRLGKMANDLNWKTIIKKSPDYGPRMKKMITRR